MSASYVVATDFQAFRVKRRFIPVSTRPWYVVALVAWISCSMGPPSTRRRQGGMSLGVGDQGASAHRGDGWDVGPPTMISPSCTTLYRSTMISPSCTRAPGG